MKNAEGVKNKSPLLLYASYFVVFVVGFLFCFLASPDKKPPENEHQKSRYISNELRSDNVDTYTFTNQLLACDDITSISDSQSTKINDLVQNYIDNKIKNKEIDSASVYFRDLNNGPWFGIGEQETFWPGSLLKVPLMMGLLKASEYDPTIMDQKTQFNNEESDVVATIKPTSSIENNKSYSTKELLEYMIRYSDNNATKLLTKLVPQKYQLDVYNHLDVSTPSSADYTITVKKYATFFRILFNATYLMQETSEQALQLLSKTEFNNGLVAGLPKSVVISHKFGERQRDDSPQVQLHDCGIVYVPGKPYLICIMTRGLDIGKLSTLIQDISRMVYNGVSDPSY